MRDLLGKRALVTGAASGIGRAVSLELARHGCHLYLLDINQVGLEAAAREARALGVQAATLRCDVSDKQQVAEAVQLAVDKWAGVDVLINNAGVTFYGITHATPEEEWERLLSINLAGPLELTRLLLPWMLARPRAHILNVCSVLGLVALPRVSLYATSKFALVGFSESLRAEYARHGLGVTAFCPGLVKTNLFQAARQINDADAPREPPRIMCTTPECVARRAVRAIRGNRRMVVMEPFARLLRRAKGLAPGLLDWGFRIGEYRKVRKKEQHLRSLSEDPVEAIRLAVAKQQSKAA